MRLFVRLFVFSVQDQKNEVSYTYTSRTVDTDQSPHQGMKVLMGVQRILK